jgi:hypothetical protein
MPKVIGKGVKVVVHGGVTIEECVGNVATQQDQLSVAVVTVSEPAAEPWLTLDYDEWICVLEGKVEMHYVVDDNEKVLTAVAGETVFVAKGERFKPVFPEGGTKYVPVCIPAFKPERCHREEEGVSDVSANLQKLHAAPIGNDAAAPTDGDVIVKDDTKLYHMCEKTIWEKTLSDKTAYFPPTFVKDGHFTHATAVPARLVETANHFYTASKEDWICVEMNVAAMKALGIVALYEGPRPVGETDVSSTWDQWQCPHIFGGIPAHVDGVVTNVYPIQRNKETGQFLSIDGVGSA